MFEYLKFEGEELEAHERRMADDLEETKELNRTMPKPKFHKWQYSNSNFAGGF